MQFSKDSHIRLLSKIPPPPYPFPQYWRQVNHLQTCTGQRTWLTPNYDNNQNTNNIELSTPETFQIYNTQTDCNTVNEISVDNDVDISMEILQVNPQWAERIANKRSAKSKNKKNKVNSI
jgi:hypothetical protein